MFTDSNITNPLRLPALSAAHLAQQLGRSLITDAERAEIDAAMVEHAKFLQLAGEHEPREIEKRLKSLTSRLHENPLDDDAAKDIDKLSNISTGSAKARMTAANAAAARTIAKAVYPICARAHAKFRKHVVDQGKKLPGAWRAFGEIFPGSVPDEHPLKQQLALTLDAMDRAAEHFERDKGASHGWARLLNLTDSCRDAWSGVGF